MRSLMCLIVAAMIASAFPVLPAQAACSGRACADLVFAASGCAIANKGSRPITLAVDIREPNKSAADDRPRISVRLAPAGELSFAEHGGCPPPKSSQFVLASYADEPPPGKSESQAKPGILSAAAKPRCSGNACQPVDLRDVDGCIWLQSMSARPIAATVAIGAEKLVVALEGADPAKVAQRQREIDSVRAAPMTRVEAERCDRALKSEAMFKQMRERGTNVPYSPDIDGVAAACRKSQAERQKAGDRKVETSYHAMIHNPLSIGTSQSEFYRSKLLPKSGCVKSIADVQTYVAEYTK